MEKRPKKLTGNYRSLLQSLWYKRDYFCRKNKLAPDGSFSYTDKRLAEEQQVSTKTITRAKKFLKENGFIVFQNGSKGRATKYWMLKRPLRGAAFKPLPAGDNLSKVGDILSQNTPQSVHLNKEITNITNKEDFNNCLKGKNLKDGIKALVKLEGVAYAKTFFITKGFSEAEVERALEGDLS